MTRETAKEAVLRQFITDEIFAALGLPSCGWQRRVLGPLCYPPARRFASRIAQFDGWVSEFGIVEATHRFLPWFVKGIEARGVELIPAAGPVLIVSNHPGAYDGFVIAACLPRDDLKIVVSDVPFTRGLPATKPHLIYSVLDDPYVRMAAVRSIIRSLRAGEIVLIFASGFVDPDPAISPGSKEAAHLALEKWSPSLELILHKAPETRVVPTIVSGVVAEACLKNPLTRLPKQDWEKRKLAEFIQIIQQLFSYQKFGLRPQVSFGAPATTAELLCMEGTSGLLEAVIRQAQRLLAEHTSPGPWKSVL